MPWHGALLRLELAGVLLELSDPGSAAVLLRELGEIRYWRSDLGVLNDRIEQLRGRLGGVRRSSSTLTVAELRGLPYLQTHLTLHEVGRRLYVSRSTVATQLNSIYRKLGVNSRRDAAARAPEGGLLGSDTVE